MRNYPILATRPTSYNWRPLNKEKRTQKPNESNMESKRTKNNAQGTMVWAAFDAITRRTYVVESNVPNSIIEVGATLAPITNKDKDRYAFIECYLFLEELVGPPNMSPDLLYLGDSSPDISFHRMRLQSSQRTSQQRPSNSGQALKQDALSNETTTQEKQSWSQKKATSRQGTSRNKEKLSAFVTPGKDQQRDLEGPMNNHAGNRGGKHERC